MRTDDNIIYCILDTGSRCTQLVSQGVTQVFFQLLAREAKTDVTDDFVIQIHYVLSKLALKGENQLYMALCLHIISLYQLGLVKI